MPLEFEHKVVLVTGAASGLGRATAIKLASLGASLALCDTDYDGLSSTARSCAPAPRYIDDVDVSSTQEVAKFVDATVAKFGALHHVFNGAGMRPRGALVEHVTDEAWDEVFSANLKGVVNVTRAAVPFLTSTSTSSITSRSITNIVSISALRGALLQSVYCAAQFGIVGFSKSVAMELEPRGVRVNVVCLETSMDDGVARDRAAVVERGSDALGKLGTPGEAVEVVLGLMAEGSRGVEESR